MKTPVEAFLAGRYLFGRKSHAAVNAITVVAVVGMAIATAAIVCVLSVFNGFRDVLTEKSDALSPDLLVEPGIGKTFTEGDSLLDALAARKDVAVATGAVTDQALMIHNGQELPVMLRGATEGSPIERHLRSMTLSGPVSGQIPAPRGEGAADALISVGVASRLDIYSPEARLTIFAPRRYGRLNPANPATSFVADSLANRGVFQTMDTDWDQNVVVTDLQTARDILQYDSELSRIELTLVPDADPAAVAADIAPFLPQKGTVKDRLEQQQINARMIDIEKWVTFLLLFFILIIASFNLVSTMSMLVIEKQSSLKLLSSIGLSSRKIGALFAWESAYVTLLGAVGGLIIGTSLVAGQMKWGWIRIGGDPQQLVIDTYPVRLEATDLLVTMIPLTVIGILTAMIAAMFARRRLGQTSD